MSSKKKSKIDPLDALIESNKDKTYKADIDKKFQAEIEKDHANNKLMERLNSELDFRALGHNKGSIEKPYYDTGKNVYCSFNIKDETANISQVMSHGIPSNDFSTKRILGKRRFIKN